MIVVGLDLGQAADFTALSAVEVMNERIDNDSQGRPQFDMYCDVRHLQRFELNTGYPEIVRRASLMMNTPQLTGKSILVPDATGVGRPVVDLLRAEKLRLMPITITFGGKAVFDVDTGYWNVPKRELVSNLQILFGNHRLRFANGLQDKDTVIKELMNFRIKITGKANDTYEAWREGDHDDLVLSVAMACWYAVKFGKEKIQPITKLSPLVRMKGVL